MAAVSAFVISQKIEKSRQCGWVLASTHTLQERTLEKKDSEAGIAPMKSLSAKCDHAVRQWGVFSQPHQCSRSSAGEHPWFDSSWRCGSGGVHVCGREQHGVKKEQLTPFWWSPSHFIFLNCTFSSSFPRWVSMLLNSGNLVKLIGFGQVCLATKPHSSGG